MNQSKKPYKKKKSAIPSKGPLVTKKELHSYVQKSLNKNVEDKLVRNNFTTGTGVTAQAGATYSLASCQQGLTQYLRIGDKTKLKRIEFGYTVSPAAAAVGTAVLCRIILAIDKQVNGANIAATADIISNTTTPANNVTCPFNPDTKGSRFIYLYDKVHNMTVQGGLTDQVGRQVVRKIIDLKNHPVLFNGGNAGNVTDIWSGDVKLIAFTDAAANTPTFGGNFNVYFEDA